MKNRRKACAVATYSNLKGVSYYYTFPPRILACKRSGFQNEKRALAKSILELLGYVRITLRQRHLRGIWRELLKLNTKVLGFINDHQPMDHQTRRLDMFLLLAWLLATTYFLRILAYKRSGFQNAKRAKSDGEHPGLINLFCNKLIRYLFLDLFQRA